VPGWGLVDRWCGVRGAGKGLAGHWPQGFWRLTLCTPGPSHHVRCAKVLQRTDQNPDLLLCVVCKSKDKGGAGCHGSHL
jgi:hypothetical protein